MTKASRCPRGMRPAADTPLVTAGDVVGCGSLADGQRSHETFGGKPRLVSVFGRDGLTASSSLGSHIAVRKGYTARTFLWWKVPRGTQWGQLDGRENLASSLVEEVGPLTTGSFDFWPGSRLSGPALSRRQAPLPFNYSAFRGPRRGARVPPALLRLEPRAVARTIVTWLILPVVICLSQRLSHACLSISNYTVKLRMAH
jgi:hypothetical protein